MIGWSDLPEELVDSIANLMSSNFDLIHIRSICKPWRAAVSTNKLFPNRRNHLERKVLPPFNGFSIKPGRVLLSSASFFRVTLPSSSCPNEGYLIKTRHVSIHEPDPITTDYDKEQCSLCSSPFSRYLITPYHQTLDLLKFSVSEIRQSYRIHEYVYTTIVVDDFVFMLDPYRDIIVWCTSGKSSDNHVWTILREKEGQDVGLFSDMILHKGHIYALHKNRTVWRISVPDFTIFEYETSTPSYDNDYMTKCYIQKRLFEYCGELCLVHRFRKRSRPKHKHDVRKSLGFKIYKMDKELVRWIEIDSLGDKTIIMDTDGCFTVLASEYYGCLKNAIYFNDGEDVSVFKVYDGSIITKTKKIYYSHEKSCFKMFSAPFLS